MKQGESDQMTSQDLRVSDFYPSCTLCALIPPPAPTLECDMQPSAYQGSWRLLIFMWHFLVSCHKMGFSLIPKHRRRWALESCPFSTGEGLGHEGGTVARRQIDAPVTPVATGVEKWLVRSASFGGLNL